MLYLAYLLIFTAVFLLVMAAANLANFRYEYAMGADVLKERRRRALESAPMRSALDPLVLAFAALIRRLGLQGSRAKIQHHLMQAGNRWGYRPEEYMGWALIVALLIAGALALVMAGMGSFNLLIPLILAAVLYLFMLNDLKHKGDQRRVELERQLPYFLDLTSLSMGAGATFLQACETAIDRPTKGPLEDEVELMLREIDAGTPLAQALTNMTTRIESPELAQMVQAVKQGEELGTPLVEVFEQQAEMNRYRRSKRGEEIAGKLPNRLALPTVFLMLAVFLLLFGPIVVRAVRGDLL